jgi:glucose-6-phosphate 1-dehydrogenase
LFNVDGQTIDENALVIRIQPDEGVSLRMSLSSQVPASALSP